MKIIHSNPAQRKEPQNVVHHRRTAPLRNQTANNTDKNRYLRRKIFGQKQTKQIIKNNFETTQRLLTDPGII